MLPHDAQSALRPRLAATFLAACALLLCAGASPAAAATDVKLNFQPASSTTPLGYQAETGQPYSAAAGRGWVREDSLSALNHAPLDLSSRTRQRYASGVDQLHNTLIHMETGGSGSANIRGAFELDLAPGSYKVTIGVGDPSNVDSVYQANAEGQPLIVGKVPTTTQASFEATGTVTVSDGRLTIDEIGGSNSKLEYLTVADAPTDDVPPDPPTGVQAVSGTGQVTTSWTASTATDIAGYNLYRSTSATVPTTGTPLNGAALLTGTSYNDTAVVSGTRYYYAVVAVDTSGNRAAATAAVSAVPTAPPPGSFRARVNFQPAGGSVPDGFTAETGGAYSSARTMGFVDAATLGAATPTPFDVSSRTRRRGVNADVKLDTLVHLDKAGEPSAAWQLKVPVGDYKVTVGAGDPTAFDSRDLVHVEGTTAIDFTPTTDARWTAATVTVRVTDGLLTVDAIGGTNTKLQYIDVAATGSGDDHTAPAVPSSLVANADLSGVHLSWAPNTEADLSGYRVYRSTTLPVPTTGTPLNAAKDPSNDPVPITSYTDTTALANETYYYTVTAVDTSANESGGTNPVSAKQPAQPVDMKVNFQPRDAPKVIGYQVDDGSAFSLARGYGWVTQDSLGLPTSGQHVPLSLIPNTRDREVVADQLRDTLIHMQGASGTSVRTPGAWEAVVPNGAYDVSVTVGDPIATDSTYTVRVEGQVAIDQFQPTTKNRFTTGDASVNVTDGRLTIDAIGGTNTKLSYLTINNADPGKRPSVGDIQPADGATLVSRGRSITAEVNLPNVGAGIDSATLNADSVYLERANDGANVPLKLNTTAGGDAITGTPRSPLEANTEYRFTVSRLLKDVSGASFIPKSSTFTTGSSLSTTTSPARFLKSPQPTSSGYSETSVAVGPDHRLYSTTLDGRILRFPINADGSLGSPTIISTVVDDENGPRSMLGLAFDPASTASSPILWVSHGDPSYANSPDWSGKISRLSGPDLSTIATKVVGLPRSVRDHQTNSLAFGPDGALYVTQGSNTATGQPDTQWGLRPERVLNAAVLRIDTTKLPASGALDVKTPDGGGSYNPFAAGAPLTIYASGIRNAYDLVWHTNGQLYVPTNGSAANGNTPATPSTLPAACSTRLDAAANGPFTGPAVPAENGIGVQPDLLFRVVKGAYYGHPDPARCEYTFMGGNPTNGNDPQDLPNYPVGTKPDRNWKPASWNFGNHFSPDGAVEYRGSAWSGALDHKLLVTRYSAGDDIVALTIDPTTKEVTAQEDGIPGLGGLTNPVDVTEDGTTGNLYVTELDPENGLTQITLLTPDQSAGTPRADTIPSRVLTNAVVGTTGPAQSVSIRNTGNALLKLTGLKLTGPDANQFVVEHAPVGTVALEADSEVTVDVRLKPTAVGVKSATLEATTDDPAQSVHSVTLRGLGTAGEGGSNEPSLQRVLDTAQIAVNVGDDDPSTNAMPAGNPLGQEVPIQAFRKAGSGRVTVDPVAVFGPAGPGSIVGRLGWNPTADGTDRTTIGSIPDESYQSVSPQFSGAMAFDPGTAPFGLWQTFAGLDDRVIYTQDALNTVAGGASHQARGYPLRDANGTVVPHAYVVAFEDLATTQDFNDVVVIVRNVDPEGGGAGRVAVKNLDGPPFDDRLAFSRIGSLASPPSNVVHDRSTVRITNTGAQPLKITSLPVTGPFQVSDPPTLPATVAAGASLDVTVRFIATSGRVSTGTLTIGSDSAVTPSTRIDLAGYWQSVSEGQQEPTLTEIVNGVFGYGTRITGDGQVLNRQGRVEAVGDEVLSPYWRRLDPTKSIRITQLASYHTQGNTAGFRVYLKGGDLNINKVPVVSAGADGQTVLPHFNGSSTSLATATYQPPAQFMFGVDSENGDPKLNSTSGDVAAGCTAPCGHHVRVWPAKNRAGQLIEGSYLVSMDYSGINYDYNDNVYLVTNIKPDATPQTVIARVDVGSSTAYTDKAGNVWSADTGLFSPAAAVPEGSASTAIANTQDDPLYGTYRGNVGSVAQAQRFVDYRFPTGGATAVDVRLFYTEPLWTAAAKRKFDVYAEGAKVLSGLDPFVLSGGTKRAWSSAIDDVAVTDGALDLRFQATTDYPSISAIEVLCREGCGGAD